ncbi:MAG: tRNA (guanosine(37)-N1)-methyltransferase TrmD [Lachnospiraceae bacterium]|nr:tRNA (guanosine(37)-N1)-methyltransferase TrmD [Lachnospiraceae bacterium]
MNFHVLTLFPEMVTAGLSESIIGKAVEKGIIGINAVNIRDFTEDKHKKTDDYIYGGGAGLLMQAQPVYAAHKNVIEKIGRDNVRTVYLTPQGKTFHQGMAEEFAKEENLIFLCGHYEGVDERVLERVVTDYVSLGDFVLTGGEPAAMVMIDAIARLVPDVLHNDTSVVEETFSGYLLEYPQYTRPEVWMGERVPKVLLSGNHKKIREWRQQRAEERTRLNRPDLYAAYEKLMQCRRELLRDKLHHMDMAELIFREKAELLYHDGEGTLLRDRIGGSFMLTAKSREAGRRILEAFLVSGREMPKLLAVHQDFLREEIEERLCMTVFLCSVQAVYTRREAPPLKLQDIRQLSVEHLKAVKQYYTTEDEAYIKDRLCKGAMFGIFVENSLAGFIGEHAEGAMGMLTVFPEYQRQGLAAALESFLIHKTLQKGYTPFCQIEEGNEASLSLQEKLGLYMAREKVWWYKRPEK